MRVLLASHPGLGHLHPLIALGQGLVHRGHDVLVASADTVGSYVESFGLKAASAGLSWLESEAERTFPGVLDWGSQGDEFGFYAEAFFDRAAHDMVPDLDELCQSWGPDLIVRNDFEFASTIVAEKRGLPLATIGLEFQMPQPIWRAMFGPQLAFLRSRYALPPSVHQVRLNGQLLLMCMPPTYSLAKAFSKPETHFVQLPVADDPEQRPLPDWLTSLPERPTIFVTLGTIYNRAPDVLQAIVAGLAGERYNVIVVTGNNQDPSVLEPLPENIRAERYLPQSRVFPLCDLVICHGGFNTLMSALSHGLLPLLVPLSAHHPMHAARCEDLSLGRALLHQGRLAEYFDHPVPELSPDSVASTVHELLEEPGYRQHVNAIQQEIQALPDVDGMVQILESLV